MSCPQPPHPRRHAPGIIPWPLSLVPLGQMADSAGIINTGFPHQHSLVPNSCTCTDGRFSVDLLDGFVFSRLWLPHFGTTLTGAALI